MSGHRTYFLMDALGLIEVDVPIPTKPDHISPICLPYDPSLFVYWNTISGLNEHTCISTICLRPRILSLDIRRYHFAWSNTKKQNRFEPSFF